MNIITFLIDFVLHIDKHLAAFTASYGMLTYFILFVVIFCETGLVVTPFLPGDSLIFAAAALAATAGTLNIWLLCVIFVAAAVIGNIVNYFIGRALGDKIYEKDFRFIKRSSIDRTKKFFDRHGGKTIIITRFMPIIRTFAPFVAGIGKMKYAKFLLYNLLGGLCWVALFAVLGYFFGGLPFVKDHFSVIIIAIIVISLVPAVVMKLMPKKAEQ